MEYEPPLEGSCPRVPAEREGERGREGGREGERERERERY